jgi:hypothetical protein
VSEIHEPAIRLIDLYEHPLVVTFNADGSAAVSHPSMCAGVAAGWLERLADVMRAEHPAFPCHWDDRRGDSEPADRPVEPTVARDGSLDAAAKVWTDGTGHRWDLSVSWDDVTGVRWQWTGSVDSNGAPLMRSTFEGGEIQPLDVIRAITGPISPGVGTEG